MIRTAARRAIYPLLLVTGAVAAVSAVAALAGSSFERAVAVGLYAVGSFMTIVGFALGSRSLFRSTRHSSSNEEETFSRLWETSEAAAVLVVIGVVLVLAGTAMDPHARLI